MPFLLTYVTIFTTLILEKLYNFVFRYKMSLNDIAGG